MKPLKIYTKAGDELRTAESVAELVGCKVATLDAYLSRGQMPAPLGAVGRTRLWSSTVVDNWLTLRGRNQVPAEGGDHHVPTEGGDGQVPAELRALRRWTRHDHKRPIMSNGEPAWAADPLTWTTYAKAKASTAGDGLGFVLNGDGIAGLDLNHCVTDGVLSTGALAILDLLPDTYAELSPSGHGVRLFCHAKVAKAHRFSSGNVEMEICGTKRFLTVTGNRLPGHPSVLADYDAVLRTLTPHASRRLQ
jgi:predicted DNA-binding transcriptional regulator AlpA